MYCATGGDPSTHHCAHVIPSEDVYGEQSGLSSRSDCTDVVRAFCRVVASPFPDRSGHCVVVHVDVRGFLWTFFARLVLVFYFFDL